MAGLSRAKLRLKVLKSGVASASKWVKRRYTRLLRSSRSRSRKLQPFRCFMTQQRSRRSGAKPGRPVRAEACRQTFLDQLEQVGILQELIDGIEQIIFEQQCLQGQRGVEEPGLVSGGVDHNVLDYIE